MKGKWQLPHNSRIGVLLSMTIQRMTFNVQDNTVSNSYHTGQIRKRAIMLSTKPILLNAVAVAKHAGETCHVGQIYYNTHVNCCIYANPQYGFSWQIMWCGLPIQLWHVLMIRWLICYRSCQNWSWNMHQLLLFWYILALYCQHTRPTCNVMTKYKQLGYLVAINKEPQPIG
jgi:hypothetical protein